MPTVDQIRHGLTSRHVTVTSIADGRDHLVDEHSTVAGVTPGRGSYLAICGHVVMAAPLVAPPGPTCLDCQTALHRSNTTNGFSRRRAGLMARLLQRGFTPTVSRSTSTGSHRAGRG